MTAKKNDLASIFDFYTKKGSDADFNISGMSFFFSAQIGNKIVRIYGKVAGIQTDESGVIKIFVSMPVLGEYSLQHIEIRERKDSDTVICTVHAVCQNKTFIGYLEIYY
ncbi:MAG: hypothetical protein NUV82_04535 [Candidatus Komeilibacteria bacterium]|nr:hypothetical protein [Candidatus Komeilibacteria bacterium]